MEKIKIIERGLSETEMKVIIGGLADCSVLRGSCDKLTDDCGKFSGSCGIYSGDCTTFN